MAPVYYHKADTAGIGFDRSNGGTGAVSQYRYPYDSLYNNLRHVGEISVVPTCTMDLSDE